MRRLLPYLLTIGAFDIIYWLTMIIPNETLYMGFGYNWLEVISNNKIPIQREIFVYGLTFGLLGINLLEIVTTKDDKFFIRLVKSILTVILTYLCAGLIYKLLSVQTWNLFYHPRGVPAIGFVFVAIFWISLGLIILEALKKASLFRFNKSSINRHVPAWLRLEDNSL